MEQNIKSRKQTAPGTELNQTDREQFLMNFAQQDDPRDLKALSPAKSFELYQSEGEDGGASIKLHMPSRAKRILENWMYDHRFYCYPSKTEKQMLSIETSLTVQKISNWFINSRRRLLPKMLEKEGRDSIDFTITRKKGKTARESTSRSIIQMEPMTNQSDESNFEPLETVTSTSDMDFHSDDANRSEHHSFVRGILYDQETECKCFFVIVD